MRFTETHDLLQTVRELQTQIVAERLRRYWPGFHDLPFAIYDDRNVYLANHPTPPGEFQYIEGVHAGPRSGEFFANTAIEFAGALTGIWNAAHFSGNVRQEEIYSHMIHEMFHAFQMENGFRPEYDEMLLLFYPFTGENLTLLVQESRELLKAVFARDASQRREGIARFAALRERRRILWPDALRYETGVETLEGTASYVEYQALRDQSGLPEEFLLSGMVRNLPEYPAEPERFRLHCYASGLCMGLLLDEAAPGWQQELFQSGKHLYDLFIEKQSIIPVGIRTDDTAYGHRIALRMETERAEKIAAFHQSSGIPLTLRGEMQVIGFDPMNAVGYDGQALHTMFLGLQSGEDRICIHGQTLAVHNPEDLWRVREAKTFVAVPPTREGEVIRVEGIGAIHGQLIEKDGGLWIDPGK